MLPRKITMWKELLEHSRSSRAGAISARDCECEPTPAKELRKGKSCVHPSIRDRAALKDKFFVHPSVREGCKSDIDRTQGRKVRTAMRTSDSARASPELWSAGNARAGAPERQVASSSEIREFATEPVSIDRTHRREALCAS
jgi:hypothetical protein